MSTRQGFGTELYPWVQIRFRPCTSAFLETSLRLMAFRFVYHTPQLWICHFQHLRLQYPPFKTPCAMWGFIPWDLYSQVREWCALQLFPHLLYFRTVPAPSFNVLWRSVEQAVFHAYERIFLGTCGFDFSLAHGLAIRSLLLLDI